MIINHKKVLFLSSHRGTKENDKLLGEFAEKGFHLLSGHEQGTFLQFLQATDEDIFMWLTQKAPPPSHFQDIVNKIRLFHHL